MEEEKNKIETIIYTC